MIPSVTARGIVNAAAYACANAGQLEKPQEGKVKIKEEQIKRKT
jgi:hypothetical protein